MNEGHAALLTVELAHEKARERGETTITREIVQSIKPLCVFTTHTPVAAGHDQFPLALVAHVITGYGHDFDERAREFCVDSVLNMTQLALDVIFRSLGRNILDYNTDPTLEHSISASEPSEATVFSASSFLEMVYAEPAGVRGFVATAQSPGPGPPSARDPADVRLGRAVPHARSQR